MSCFEHDQSRRAFLKRAGTIIMGVTIVSAVAIVLGNLLADMIAPFVDPRIKLR